VLNLEEQSQVLDVGCGLATRDEYISDVTKANIAGIDFAGLAILAGNEFKRAIFLPSRYKIDSTNVFSR
jgi:cyclopropane fatty-acyl-phospholipid synthase-like methyltransferase